LFHLESVQSLVLAGIYDDVKKVYSELLTVAAGDSRKAIIKKNLQKIHFIKSTEKSAIGL